MAVLVVDACNAVDFERAEDAATDVRLALRLDVSELLLLRLRSLVVLVR